MPKVWLLVAIGLTAKLARADEGNDANAPTIESDDENNLWLDVKAGQDVKFTRTRRETVTAFGLQESVDELERKVGALEANNGTALGLQASVDELTRRFGELEAQATAPSLGTAIDAAGAAKFWIAIAADAASSVSSGTSKVQRGLYCAPQHVDFKGCLGLKVYARGLIPQLPFYSIEFANTNDPSQKARSLGSSAVAVDGTDDLFVVQINVPVPTWVSEKTDSADITALMALMEGDAVVSTTASKKHQTFRWVQSHWTGLDFTEGYRDGVSFTTGAKQLGIFGAFTSETTYRMTFTSSDGTTSAHVDHTVPKTASQFSQRHHLTIVPPTWPAMVGDTVETSVTLQELSGDGAGGGDLIDLGYRGPGEPTFTYRKGCSDGAEFEDGECVKDQAVTVSSTGSASAVSIVGSFSHDHYVCALTIGQISISVDATRVSSGGKVSLQCYFSAVTADFPAASYTANGILKHGDGEELAATIEVPTADTGCAASATFQIHRAGEPTKLTRFPDGQKSLSVCFELPAFALANPEGFVHSDGSNVFDNNGFNQFIYDCDFCAAAQTTYAFGCPEGYAPYLRDLRSHCCHDSHIRDYCFETLETTNGFTFRQRGDNCGDPNEAVFQGICRRAGSVLEATAADFEMYLYDSSTIPGGPTLLGQHGNHFWYNAGGDASCEY